MSRAANLTALLVGFAFICTVPAFAQSARDRAKSAAAERDYKTADSLYRLAIKESPKDMDVLLEAGDVAMEVDDPSRAREIFQQALQIDSKSSGANRRYGLALSALHDNARAIEALQAALKYDDKAVENYLALGRAYIASGNDSLSKAELTFQKASQKFPSSASVAVALGDLYYARQIYQLAQEKYEEAIALDESLVEPRMLLGRTYRELAKRAAEADEANDYYNKSLRQFNKITEISPKYARAWYEQGEIFMLAHDYEKAGRSFEQYVKLRPEDPRGDVMLGRAAFLGNYFKQAVEPLERVLGRSDSISKAFADSAHMMIAKSYYAVKDYAKARAMYGLVQDSMMSVEGTKFYASSMLLSGGDTIRAIEVYRKLVDANPQDCDLSSSLGQLLYKMKRYDAVIDVFTKRMASCPDAPKSTPYLYIGLSHFTQKRYDKAIEAFNGSIAADSSVSQPYFWLMNAFASQKQFGKAAAVGHLMADRGMDKTDPKEVATGYFFGGTEKFQAKDFKGAIAEFERALKLNPENSQTYLYVAFAYQSLSDKDNACKYYKLTLKYDPKNAEARKNMKAVGCTD
ncbi:MAG: tetratricopeptide repeat protein [Bacteroidota bacterium]